jgi:inner membrane protein involved in colicin E2 resistance
LLSIAAGMVACYLIFRNKGNGFVTAVFVWALTGIAFKSYQSNELLVLVGSVLGMLIAPTGYLIMRSRSTL